AVSTRAFTRFGRGVYTCGCSSPKIRRSTRCRTKLPRWSAPISDRSAGRRARAVLGCARLGDLLDQCHRERLVHGEPDRSLFRIELLQFRGEPPHDALAPWEQAQVVLHRGVVEEVAV